MAGSVWTSSHHAQWIQNKTDVLREYHMDFQVLSEDEYKKYFTLVLFKA
uniref:Cyclin-C n=1 Tax=Lepeophtheirus salmonis TaxID=72036 RepID=C1BS78_LEPSM|nr:Cyclin-C [Lepeophtheirus salmonis]